MTKLTRAEIHCGTVAAEIAFTPSPVIDKQRRPTNFFFINVYIQQAP
jgi:hypothetical protein